MNYPERYTLGDKVKTIQEGDLVWWNEGVCVGFVLEVMEEPAAYEAWGLDEPSIAFTNLHPFEANFEKHPQHIGSVVSGGTVVLTPDQLEDDGVGLLSPHERNELDWAIHKARSLIDSSLKELPFCVTAILDMERNEEDWIFHFVDTECTVQKTVCFPFRPNTRDSPT